ncbi:MAG: hypothetical protein O3B23_09065 [Actinomycetota bacterium]|nr:hypothetical protein [Actinomycetota bacterium]
MSLRQLSELAQVSNPYLSQIERGPLDRESPQRVGRRVVGARRHARRRRIGVVVH